MPWSETGLPDSLLTNGNTPDTPFTVTTQQNTPGGKLKGYELSAQRPFTFLPAPFDKFGAHPELHPRQERHPVRDQEPDLCRHPAGADRAGGADHPAAGQPVALAFNATLYYENGPFKARVSGSYRDAYLIQVAPSATNNNDVRIKEKTFNLDTQVSYAFDKFTVTLEGINLTDQEDSKVDDSARMISEEYVHFGRQYYLGVKYKF
jgi:iron complex outermembrane receptor protein